MKSIYNESSVSMPTVQNPKELKKKTKPSIPDLEQYQLEWIWDKKKEKGKKKGVEIWDKFSGSWQQCNIQ